MAKSLFTEEMLASGKNSMNLESIIQKLTYFENQLQLIHWQTANYAEHQALNLYDDVHDFKDDVVEKLMGYLGVKPKVFKFLPIQEASSVAIVKELKEWSYQLYLWAEEQKYCDIENMAQDLSGKAAKTLFLLTLS